MNNKINQLIILGNGFDLACGLQSQYKDFFQFRYENLGNNPFSVLKKSIEDHKTSLESLQTNSGNKQINGWDLIFTKYHKDSNDPKAWREVESSIAEWILHPRGKEQYAFDLIYEQDSIQAINKGTLRTIYTVDDITPCHQHNPNLLFDEDHKGEKLQWEKHMDIYDPLEVLRALRYEEKGIQSFDAVYWEKNQPGHPGIKKNGKWDHTPYGDTFRDFLFSELHYLERDFEDYLEGYPMKNETNGFDEYQKIAGPLLKKITQADIPLESTTNNYVLSFNYTRPTQYTNISSFRNIHGRLGKELIFGIDSEGNLRDNHISQFTKTVRIFNSKTDDYTDESKIFEPLDNGENFQYIKLFGHGLSEADYSYFQSIFDRIDIYNPPTKIYFYYTENYRPDYQTIINLINRYAERQPIEGRRINMLHKIILENRLKIVKLD